MDDQISTSLEKALAKTEEDSANCLKNVQLVAQSLRKLRRAARLGEMKGLRAAMDSARNAESALRQQMDVTQANWTFPEEDYLSNGSFIREVTAVAEQKGVRVFVRDDRLYCYPVLIRVLPGERAIRIDKAMEKRLRPTTLVSQLKELQKKPPRFRQESFIEALYQAYEKAVRLSWKPSKGTALLPDDRAPKSGIVVPLVDLYELFTLLPGQAKEYSRQEFARDIYLLDRSGLTKTHKGAEMRMFTPSSGAKAGHILGVINETGDERKYYSISFSPPNGE